ncbi:MAG: hypothetical protein H7339_08050 [Arcicella sp.]|nr:hypothetical protein [Arcicella sp.]
MALRKTNKIVGNRIFSANCYENLVMAYVLSIQHGLENKVEKKKIYKNKPSRLVVSYFRKGLSIIKAKIWSLNRFIGVLNDIFKNTDQGKLLYVQ